MLLPEPTSLLAVDVETHALIPVQPRGSWWQVGRFGIDTTVCDEDIASLHAVQVGWTFGSVDAEDPETKVRLVRPDGFEIEEAAAKKHGITHARAMREGFPLRVALQELVADVEGVVREGGRICSHHLGFDAGVLAYAMERLELHDLAAKWSDIVRGGICTMNQHVGHWVRKQIGIGDKPMKIPLRLVDGIKALLPQHGGLLADHHDAGTDSRMHFLLAVELITRAKAR